MWRLKAVLRHLRPSDRANPVRLTLLVAAVFTATSGSAISGSPIPFVPIDLGTLGGTYSAPTALNDNGQVVGFSLTPADRDYHAFLWTREAGMIDLGTLGGTYSVATALNNSGQVVGYSGDRGDNQHAFSWTNADGMTDLHRVADTDRFSFPLAVSARGQVVGYSFSIYPAPFFSYAFSWTKADGWIDLTSGSTTSSAAALNGSGEVVGWMDTPPYGYGYRAFLWTPIGGVVDLGTLDDGTLSWASDVNVRGQVVGSSRSSAGIDQAFVWTQESGMLNSVLPG